MIRTVRTPSEQVPGVYRLRVGDIVVTALSDGYLEAGLEVLLNISAEEAQDLLQRAGRPVRPRAPINAFAIHSEGRIGLIDTGAGPALGPTAGRLAANLAAAGIHPNEIDTVLLTHMHPDHSPGLIDPVGVPVFQKAELRLHEDEAAYWQDDTALSRAAEPIRSFFHAARAQLGLYRDRVRPLQLGEVFPGVTWMPIGGHTPGHTAYRIASGDSSLLIWGDIVHIQDVQIPRPDTGFFIDSDPVAAAATRRRVLDMVAADRLLVGGMHVHFPGFARVVRDGTSFRMVPDVWSDDL
jgi:glyoxylase-like metal-dependent hydrolase (beta-lactamase superfamily II)